MTEEILSANFGLDIQDRATSVALTGANGQMSLGTGVDDPKQVTRVASGLVLDDGQFALTTVGMAAELDLIPVSTLRRGQERMARERVPLTVFLREIAAMVEYGDTIPLDEVPNKEGSTSDNNPNGTPKDPQGIPDHENKDEEARLEWSLVENPRAVKQSIDGTPLSGEPERSSRKSSDRADEATDRADASSAVESETDKVDAHGSAGIEGGSGGTRVDGMVIPVPGVADSRDFERVSTAAADAGLSDVEVVRRPLGVGASELLTDDVERVLAVYLGDTWTDVAVVAKGKDNVLRVPVRQTTRSGSRERVDNLMTDHVLESSARDLGVELEVRESARESVRAVVHDLLEAVDVDDVEGSARELSLTLSDGVSVTAGGLLTRDGVPLTTEIGLFDCYRVLEPEIEGVRATIKSVLDGREEDIDRVVLGGPGAEVLAIEHGIADLVDVPIASAGQHSRSAVGAALLAGRTAGSGDSPVATTPVNDLDLQFLTADGLTSEPLISAGEAITEATVALRRVSDNDSNGYFELRRPDRVAGQPVWSQGYVIRAPVPDAVTDPIEISIELPEREVKTNYEDPVPQVSLKGSPGADQTILESVNDRPAEVPWLTGADHDPSAVESLEETDGEPDPDDGRVTQIDPVTATLGEERDETLADIVLSLWNKLRERTRDDGDPLEPDEIEILLNEFDSRLGQHDIEVIAPEVGAELDPKRHEVLGVRERPEPEGTILEVLEHGLSVKGVAVEEAVVVVAE